jgi:hypothetical protein
LKLTWEEKKTKNLVAESLFRFSLNVFTLSLLNKSLETSTTILQFSKDIASGWLYIACLGILILLVSIFIWLPFKWGKKWVLENALEDPSFKNLKYLGYSIILVLFGEKIINVFQPELWAVFVGLFCIGAGIGCFVYCLKNLFSPSRQKIINTIMDRRK